MISGSWSRFTWRHGHCKAPRIIEIGLRDCVTIVLFPLSRCCDNLTERELIPSGVLTGCLKIIIGEEVSSSTSFSNCFDAVHHCCVCSLWELASFPSIALWDYTNHLVAKVSVRQLISHYCVRPRSYHWDWPNNLVICDRWVRKIGKRWSTGCA